MFVLSHDWYKSDIVDNPYCSCEKQEEVYPFFPACEKMSMLVTIFWLSILTRFKYNRFIPFSLGQRNPP